MTSPDEPLRTAVDALADGRQFLARSRTAAVGGDVLALVGIGHMAEAMVLQQHEFYRELVNLLDDAKNPEDGGQPRP